MIDVGIVGLDTSHPEAFAEQLDSHSGATVSAIWDDGSVRTPKYARDFCAQFSAKQYDEPMELLGKVDAVMVLAANWDTHRSLSVPFLNAGVPTLIDKPLAGHLSDVEAIADAAKDTPLFGGSAVPFHPLLAELPVNLDERTLYCAGYNDPFYYGAHIIDTARLLAGADWHTVEPSSGPGVTVEITFENNTQAVCRLDGPTEEAAFGVLDVADRTRVREISSDEHTLSEMYDEYIDEFLAVACGERDDSNRLTDSARLLLAVRAALEKNNRITPLSRELQQVRVNGRAFLENYTPYY